MVDDGTKYETKTVQAIRGMESRTRAKWEADGWELVEEDGSGLLRTKLTFRRPKKQVPRWAWIAGLIGLTALVAIIAIGALTEDDETPAPSPTVSEPAEEPSATPSATPSVQPAPEPEPTTVPTEQPTTNEGETTLGLGFGWAQTACNNAGDDQFPFGYDGHTLLGLINEEAQGEVFFLKYTADITNQFDAEQEVTIECSVTGTDGAPEIVSFYAY